MKLLLVGALSWNPERVRSLCEHGHELWGLWSRSMAWEQGPYPAIEDCVPQVAPGDAATTIREQGIDCVLSLYQAYDRRLWGPPSPGVEHDVWDLVRSLLGERKRGRFDVPIVHHWGYDVQNLDPRVAAALDGHIFCNREKLDYWSLPADEGGRGLDVFGDEVAHFFLDGDQPKLEFMNDRFSEPLSQADGEIHTVCVGRPIGIDFLAAARCGVHVHVYSNSVDDVYRTIAGGMSPVAARRGAALLERHIHVHEPLQPAPAADWSEVRDTKARWVGEFSRYDAAWSYIGTPFGRDRLDDLASIPNRLGTYLLAGLPVITDHRPRCYRYEELRRRGADVTFDGRDYDALRAKLEDEVKTREGRDRARAARRDYSFDATIDPLVAALERVRERYFAQSHAQRRRFDAHEARLFHIYDRRRRLRGAWRQRRLFLAPLTSRALARTLGGRG